MTEEIAVYLKDMETFLGPEEYQAFLKAGEKIEEYRRRRAEYEQKKGGAEWFKSECLKERDEAESDIVRNLWYAHALVSSMEAALPAPYEPTYYFQKHDYYVGLVRERKLNYFEEEQRRKAEEEAQKQHEEQMMHAAIRQKNLADSEWQQFSKALNVAIKDLKHQLAHPEPPKFAFKCSQEVFKYCPHSWCGLELPSDDEVKMWAKPQIMEKIPEILRSMVTLVLTPQIVVVPRVEYELVGVPCLAWYFDIYISAKGDLWMKESIIKKEFHGFKYVAPLKEQKLGSFRLGYQLWDTEQGFSTPIALLVLLSEDKLEGLGIEISSHKPSQTVYEVSGYTDGYVAIHKSFCKFIRDSAASRPLPQGLLDHGLLDQEGANLVELKWNHPLPVNSDITDAGGSDMEDVVSKLVELGWTEDNAKKAVEGTTLPNNAVVEDKVKIIIQKSYANSL